jgi:hypothetical protein
VEVMYKGRFHHAAALSIVRSVSGHLTWK